MLLADAVGRKSKEQLVKVVGAKVEVYAQCSGLAKTHDQASGMFAALERQGLNPRSEDKRPLIIHAMMKDGMMPLAMMGKSPSAEIIMKITNASGVSQRMTFAIYAENKDGLTLIPMRYAGADTIYASAHVGTTIVVIGATAIGRFGIWKYQTSQHGKYDVRISESVVLSGETAEELSGKLPDGSLSPAKDYELEVIALIEKASS